MDGGIVLLLKPGLTRLLNIGLGLFFTLFTVTVGLSSLSEWRMFYVFLSFLESVITLVVVYQAWTWPKAEAA